MGNSNEVLKLLASSIGRAIGALFNAEELSGKTGYVLLVFPLAPEGKEAEKQQINYSSNIKRDDAMKLLKEFAVRSEFEASLVKLPNPFVDSQT